MIEWVAFAVRAEGEPSFLDAAWCPRERKNELGRFPAPDRWAAYGEARQRWPDVPCVVVQSVVSYDWDGPRPAARGQFNRGR